MSCRRLYGTLYYENEKNKYINIRHRFERVPFMGITILDPIPLDFSITPISMVYYRFKKLNCIEVRKIPDGYQLTGFFEGFLNIEETSRMPIDTRIAYIDDAQNLNDVPQQLYNKLKEQFMGLTILDS